MENEVSTYPNLRETMKAVQRVKFTALRAFRRKLESSHSRLESISGNSREKEASTQRREIIKIRDEINQLETNKQYK